MAVEMETPSIYLVVMPVEGDTDIYTISPHSTQTMEAGYWNGREWRDYIWGEFENDEAAALAGWLKAQHIVYDLIEVLPLGGSDD